MAAIITDTISLTVMCRVLWFCSHDMKTVVFKPSPTPHYLDASDATMCMVELGEMMNPVPFQEAANNFHQAKSDRISTDKRI